MRQPPTDILGDLQHKSSKLKLSFLVRTHQRERADIFVCLSCSTVHGCIKGGTNYWA